MMNKGRAMANIMRFKIPLLEAWRGWFYNLRKRPTPFADLALSETGMAAENFRRLFDLAPIAIAVIDNKGEIERANSAFSALVEAPFSHSPIFEFIHPDDKNSALEHFALMHKNRLSRTSMELRLKGKGQEHTVMAYCALREEKGQINGCVAHFIDVTELKRLQTQFAQSQKMQAVGLLAGGIAHDFNNLLTAMIGFCDLLLLRHRPGDESFADIMQIKQNSNRAANLVRQLLAFSRQQTLQPRILPVTEILADLVHLLRRLMGETVELEMIHGKDISPIRADQSQFEQVIVNLAVNARDAMPEGGRLSIATRNIKSLEPLTHGDDVMPAGDYVLVEISDTGSGIDPHIIGRIFEPFFSTKATGAGTGLGLSTVYGIVRQSGGFVNVESVVGQGTVFRLYFPAYHAKAENTGRTESSEEQVNDLSGMGAILLVEDEDAVRLFAARALRNKGYRVFEARGGEAALEIAEAELPDIDLVLSDVVMPRMDGPALIRELRKKRPALPVIFMSGYAEEDFRRKIDKGEEAYFLVKPFTLKQLAEKVKEAISSKVTL